MDFKDLQHLNANSPIACKPLHSSILVDESHRANASNEITLTVKGTWMDFKDLQHLNAD
jgi:hypothetical protein